MTNDTTIVTEKRLYRSETDKMLAGVAGGIAEYFVTDPTLVRLLFVLATLFGGAGIPVYVVLWIILPSKKDGEIATKTTMKENTQDIKNKITGKTGNGRMIIATLLIGFGLLTLLDNFKIFNTEIFWPFLLILIGVLMLRR